MRVLFILFCLFGLNLHAQQKYYFVAFKNKPNYKSQLSQPLSYISKKAVERRLKNRVPLNVNDIPPDSAYLEQIRKFPLMMYGNSRWLNGVVILTGYINIIDTLEDLDFVSKVVYLGPQSPFIEEDQASNTALDEQISILEQTFETKPLVNDTLFLGKSFKQINQLNARQLLLNNKNGKGVLIAVIDAGFKNADQLKALKPLFNEGRIFATYDFVEKEEEVFDDDEHGLAVLSCMAAFEPGSIMGTAHKANYILLRSENAASEYLLEEYLWTLAAEYADSAGVDIINSSLGYTKHDDKKMGHKYSDLDGETTIITQAAEIACSKGILVFVSAGNEGNETWKQLSTPGDAEHVLTVGAIDDLGVMANFSSTGPTADRRIKPDLVALGKSTSVLSASGKVYFGNGTSYACPVLAGTAAILMELAPNKSPQQIKDVMVLSGSNFYKPDKYLGSGIPDIELCSRILCTRDDSLLDARVLDDNNLYVLIHCKTDQKITLLLSEPKEGELTKSTFSVKKGPNRLLVKGYKKRPGGMYHLSVQFPTKLSFIDLIKP
ncbi:MAG: S8 family serine peptidase [Bacteroidota bacterium]|nr:S8 family serine peptidase [Bacteroidota bacterium]